MADHANLELDSLPHKVRPRSDLGLDAEGFRASACRQARQDDCESKRKSSPVLALGRRLIGWKFFGEATALGCLANVLEGGVEAIIGRISAVSLLAFSGAAGAAGSPAAIRRAVSLVLVTAVRVCAGAARAGISLGIGRCVVAVWARIGPRRPLWRGDRDGSSGFSLSAIAGDSACSTANLRLIAASRRTCSSGSPPAVEARQSS